VQGLGQSAYEQKYRSLVFFAVAEALSWLTSQGLIIIDPSQVGNNWFRPTRRAQAMRNRADVETFRNGRLLSTELLTPSLAEK
jgi:hypothetical protein